MSPVQKATHVIVMLAENLDYCLRIRQALEQRTSNPNEALLVVSETIEFLKAIENRPWIRTTSAKNALSMVRSNLADLELVVKNASPQEIDDQAEKLRRSIEDMRKAYERSKWVVT